MEADARPLDLVRGEVKQILNQSPAWQELDPEQRRAFAQNMVKVSHFLAKDPGWLDLADDPGVDAPPAPAATALAKAGEPIEDLKKRMAGKPGQVDFKASAVRQGVEEFGNLVKTVDFPDFVSGLIQGVFQAIVDASIQQMQAYGELLAATAKSVDQFASDHITDDQAREQLATRNPSLVVLERTPEGTRIVPKDGVDDEALRALGRGKPVNLDDAESERKFVLEAKLEMA